MSELLFPAPGLRLIGPARELETLLAEHREYQAAYLAAYILGGHLATDVLAEEVWRPLQRELANHDVWRQHAERNGR